MKKMLAIATVAALLGGGSAFAAESQAVRLDDAQMDGLTAGKSGGANSVIIVPITSIDLTQLGVAIGDGTTVTNNAVITVINNIVVIQQLGNGKFKLPQTNNGNHFGQLKATSGPG